MKSRFLTKTYVVALLTVLEIFLLIGCSNSRPNWKRYFEDNEYSYYYDQNSIHYTHLRKNFFGKFVKDKEIVNVWIKVNNGSPQLVKVYCEERTCDGCEPNHSSIDSMVESMTTGNEISGNSKPIQPGSKYESLLNNICP
ncbi:MAG TPA: hypothetical protein PK941_13465 [Paludibacter sp.]|jgi:hypothetical protein|nr:hypothetical protein [Paludibacter sp.]